MSTSSRMSGGFLFELIRELEGIIVAMAIEPGIYLDGEIAATTQQMTKITIEGSGSPPALAEIARELATLKE